MIHRVQWTLLLVIIVLLTCEWNVQSFGLLPHRSPSIQVVVFPRHAAYWQEFAESLLEGIDESFQEQQWYLPSIVECALIHQDTTVDPYQLLQSLDMSDRTREHALMALKTGSHVHSIPSVLTSQECVTLQNYINKHVQNELGLDNVDQCPDWQVNIELDDLVKLLGQEAVHRIYNIIPDITQLVHSEHFQRVGIFLRVYQRGERPWMPFHSDGNAYTVNVALNHDSDFEGGRLLALTDGKLQILERRQGDATVHQGSVYHAVSAMKGDQRRYSMILFFHSTPTTIGHYS